MYAHERPNLRLLHTGMPNRELYVGTVWAKLGHSVHTVFGCLSHRAIHEFSMLGPKRPDVRHMHTAVPNRELHVAPVCSGGRRGLRDVRTGVPPWHVRLCAVWAEFGPSVHPMFGCLSGRAMDELSMYPYQRPDVRNLRTAMSPRVIQLRPSVHAVLRRVSNRTVRELPMYAHRRPEVCGMYTGVPSRHLYVGSLFGKRRRDLLTYVKSPFFFA